MPTSQGGICIGDIAKPAVYFRGFRETSPPSNRGSICKPIYESSHPGGTSSLAILWPSFASSFRAS